MTRSKTSGQMLLIALLIMATLAMTLPLVFTLFDRLQRLKADLVVQMRLQQAAQAGFAHARQAFMSHPELWTRAMAGDRLSDEGFDGEREFVGVHQVPYKIVCAKEATLLPNQLRVNVHVAPLGKGLQKKKIFQAIFSRRTMGADVAALHAPAALYTLGDLDLTRKGLADPELDVHWGSIVCYGTMSLAAEPNAENLGHHPRKFCRGGFNAPYLTHWDTQSRDVWTKQLIGDPVLIDEDKYHGVASSQSQYHSAPSQAVVIRSVPEFPPDVALPVFFFNSSVRFESPGIDLGVGAMIVTQNAIFADQQEGKVLDLRVPPQAAREYPYLPPGARFPCQNAAGATCSSAEALGEGRSIDFRGFLYVKGDLYIQKNTMLAGVLRVDGRIRVRGGNRLTVLFDDRVSRSIFTVGTELVEEIIIQ